MDELKKHEPDYKPDAWRDYTAGELGMWVHLLRKRAAHRACPIKQAKDEADADNYEAMLREVLKA